jgi:hypothetical protein
VAFFSFDICFPRPLVVSKLGGLFICCCTSFSFLFFLFFFPVECPKRISIALFTF